MPVNQDGTTPDDALMDALGQAEQQPTAEADVAQQDGIEGQAEDAVEADEDAELEDEADADEGEEADAGTPRYTVKVNGQEAKVSLNELKEGYMKDADYRRKTSELAESRKRIEGKEAEYEGGLKTLGDQLELVATFIASQINMDEGELDKLAESNPAEFVKAQRLISKQGNALQNVHAQLERVKKAQIDAQQRKLAEFAESETAKLHEANPEFRKTETVERLHKYLKESYGLSKDEIASVVDHRFALIAEKARRYDAIKSKAALKEKQVQKNPGKFQKGGAAARGVDTAKANQRALEKVMSTGRVEDLAGML